MRKEKELRTLSRLISSAKDTENALKDFIDFQNKNLITIDTTKKLSLLRNFESKLFNTLSAIKKKRDIFKNQELYDKLSDYIDKINFFSDRTNTKIENEKCSLFILLKKARDWEEHSEKLDEEKYRHMADDIDIKFLVVTFNLVSKLLNSEIESLSQDELKTLITNSEKFKSKIGMLQKEFEPITDLVLNNERVSQGMKKIFSDFLDFKISKDNIHIINDD